MSGGYGGKDGPTKTPAKAAMSATEASRRCVAEAKQFCVDFAQKHRDIFRELSAEAPSGLEEQKHEWYNAYERYMDEAEVQVHLAAEKWGVLKEAQFETEFIEWAATSDEFYDFLKTTDYQSFITMMRKVLHQPDASRPQPFKPLPEEVYAIDKELAKLEKERQKLLAQRRKLIGRGPEAPKHANVKIAVDKQRFKDDIGLD